MNIPNWMKKIWRTIRSFFSKIPDEARAAIHIGVMVTENIKNFIDSPAADVLTAIIPGNVDDGVKIALRKALPVILTQLRLADQCAQSSSPAEITLCALKTIRGITGQARGAFLHNLSVLIATVAADGKLSWQDGAYVMEWYYQQKFKNSIKN
jgi:hypothetical protein